MGRDAGAAVWRGRPAWVRPHPAQQLFLDSLPNGMLMLQCSCELKTLKSGKSFTGNAVSGQLFPNLRCFP